MQINCKCGELIVKAINEDNMKVRSKIIVFKGNAAYAVCKSCDQEVKVPLQVDSNMLKSLSTESKHVPLYVRKFS